MLTPHDHEVAAVVGVMSVSLYFTAAIVSLRSSVGCCGVQVALGREGHHKDNNLDRGVVLIVDDDEGLSRETNKHGDLDCSNCNQNNICNGSNNTRYIYIYIYSLIVTVADMAGIRMVGIHHGCGVACC